MVIRRLQALYLRYAAVHADRLRGVPLGRIGRRIGQVERVVRRGDVIEITGWAKARDVKVTWAGGERRLTPNIYRGDVAAQNAIAPETGFEGAIPASARHLKLHAERDDGEVASVPLSHPDEAVPNGARRRLRRAFLRDLTKSLPTIAQYQWRPTAQRKTAVKRALGLETAARGHLIDPAWLPAHRCEPDAAAGEEVTIILPIYNALPYLKKCLARVEAGTDLPWHLIAVNDASTDPELGPWLEEWVAERRGKVTYLPQTRNLGFIGAVNLGLEAAERRGGDGPIVLLNTDAMLPDGWASRLTAPLEDPAAASVTPLSNAAEVLSVPKIGPGIALGDGDVDAIDRVATTLGVGPVTDVPTGVGFCMAMARPWLAKVPRLDPAFGRGYGEEVDWCQKTKALGARHLCQPRLFVEHVGGQSFGSEEKLRQMRASNALISRRYPVFDANVQRFISEDPLATPRLALGIALASRHRARLPVFLAHSLGGGAEIAMQMEIEALGAAVILRVGGPRLWQVEVQVKGQTTSGQTDDLSVVKRLLRPAAALDLIYSCGVGDRDPITLPDALLALRRAGRDDTIALRLHDYFPLSPSYTLLEQGEFLGTPDRDNIDPHHTAGRPDGTTVSLAHWRDRWGALVAAASEVTAFSHAAAALAREAYPDAPLVVRPHRLPTQVRRVRAAHGGCIGILGNINHQKGAWVLREAAMRHPGQTFVVIGHADSAIPMPRNVILHGAYRREEIADLAERYGVSGWLVPAIWPETFSFTTHEALDTGLPVVGFSLGAQGETLAAASNGTAVPLEPKDTSVARLIEALYLEIAPKEAAE
ncbi:glycosyltransferase [Gymnodinialimonas ceratoperidinii]|uniref:Glycosyltransferase n=1 Tax=Gymnodinialimonas ceratoperidinii TaxID=2856823 RepID=A0A8F6YBB8_9RHOB|nr:glycosyltransferase [Gymnodinialimonas ceratoperidinii]QXT40403.1 glycosyltransferase [Gymnodinialimonas ceratoperidinii]